MPGALSNAGKGFVERNAGFIAGAIVGSILTTLFFIAFVF